MHVGSLQLFQPPDGATAQDVSALFDQALAEHRGRAAVPEAGAPVDHVARAVGLGGRRAVRPRAPRPQERAAAAGAGARAARAVLAAALVAARPAPSAVGDAPDRGPQRRPVRDLLQVAPRTGRRGVGAAGAEPDAVRRPRRPSTCRRRGRRGSVGRSRRASAPARCRSTALQQALSIAGDVAGLASGARAHRRTWPQRAGRQRVVLRAEDDVQRPDHRGAPVRRAVVADRADPAGRQGVRRDRQRRRAHDVLGCAALVPARRGRAAGRAADRDGAGVAARRGVGRRRRRRQLGRRGDVQPRHASRRSRSSGCRPCTSR